MLGPEYGFPLCDGWQHATAYQWMLNHTLQNRLVMVTPDLTMPDGDIASYSIPLQRQHHLTVHPKARFRAAGLVCLARTAHAAIEQHVANQS